MKHKRRKHNDEHDDIEEKPTEDGERRRRWRRDALGHHAFARG
jgi:hypothetical protein